MLRDELVLEITRLSFGPAEEEERLRAERAIKALSNEELARLHTGLTVLKAMTERATADAPPASTMKDAVEALARWQSIAAGKAA